MKILAISNLNKYDDFKGQIERSLEYFKPWVSFTVSPFYTFFEEVTFDTAAPGQRMIKDTWLKDNLLSISYGYDIVLFHVHNDQWGGLTANGWTTIIKDMPPVIQIHSDPGEFAWDNMNYSAIKWRLIHEVGHALCWIKTGDLHGDWLDGNGGDEKLVPEAMNRIFPKPNTDEQMSVLRKKIASLELKLRELISLRDELLSKQDYLDKFCLAIQEFEGWSPGSRSWRNQNPGNIRFVGQRTAIGQDKDNFAVFPSYEVGFGQLKTLVRRAAMGYSSVYRPDMSITEFFRTYAPASDNNHPDRYAKFVASKVGLSVDNTIKELI